uniref:Zinc finger protein-like 1 homolog (Trinotate prediction) n=1 Tax=Henneguya salminicola TaxID=69463 RepID=A0A6G3MH88_HENSL
MGICRCHRLSTTNHFCYEHRMNVCQYCVLESHQNCIVKSYNSWLNSSEFNAICLFCGEKLDIQECIRLYCWDVVHKNCLASKYNDETDPIKIICPECSAPIIPPSNAESPIADELNSILPNIGWYQNLIDSGFKPSVYSPTRKTPKSNETFSSVNQTLDSSCIIN